MASVAGAVTERLDPLCAFAPDDVPALRSLVEQLAREPERLGAWHDRLPRPKSAEDHALEIEGIYEELLRARAATGEGG